MSTSNVDDIKLIKKGLRNILNYMNYCAEKRKRIDSAAVYVMIKH